MSKHFGDVAGLVLAFADHLPTGVTIDSKLSSDAPPLPLVLRADQHLTNCSSFHYLEYNAAGDSYRWTGPSAKITFWIALAGFGVWRARLRFMTTDEPRNLTDTTFFVDGVEKKLTFGESGGFHSFESEACTAEPAGETELTFVLAGTTAPQDSDPSSSDARRLGVAWHDLEIAPAA